MLNHKSRKSRNRGSQGMSVVAIVNCQLCQSKCTIRKTFHGAYETESLFSLVQSQPGLKDSKVPLAAESIENWLS